MMTFVAILILWFAIWNGFSLRIGRDDENFKFNCEVEGLSNYLKARKLW